MKSDLKNMNDLQLILKYQDTKKDFYAEYIIDKYNKIIYMYSWKTYKKLISKNNCCYFTIDDIQQDYKYYFLILLTKINREKIKKDVIFNFKMMIYNYFNAYIVVIEHKYNSFNCDYIEDVIPSIDSYSMNRHEREAIISFIKYDKEKSIENAFIVKDTFEKFEKSLNKNEQKILNKIKNGVHYTKVEKYYKYRNTLKNKYMQFADIRI